MNLFHAIVLGVVQGLTEFLPISSSGHLIVFPHVFGWIQQPLAFDTTLHLGTAAALVVYFFKDLLKIVSGFVRDIWNFEDEFSKFSHGGKLGLYILLGSVPAGVIGFLFNDKIESVFRTVEYVVLFLILGSALMLFAERLGKWKKNKKVGYLESLVIGLFQSLALLPGISRSGSTISGGMLFGLNREEAARFSFLLSIPIVVLAGGFELKTSLPALQGITWQLMLAGFLSSFAVGLLTIKFLLDFLKEHDLWVFVVYRFLLAVFLLLYI